MPSLRPTVVIVSISAVCGVLYTVWFASLAMGVAGAAFFGWMAADLYAVFSPSPDAAEELGSWSEHPRVW